MKLLVFGKSGQVATELARHDNVINLCRDQADLTNPERCAAIIAQTDADAVINAAAFTNVDLAETQEPLANLVNGTTPASMANAAAKRGVAFLHISSDYVFDGTGHTPRKETSLPAPIGAYGRSKLLGERGVMAAGGNFAILRTSWVFSASGNNFVNTMLKLAYERSSLSVVNDQIGGPTPATDIANALVTMAVQMVDTPAPGGIYHFSGAPETSWYKFAREIFAISNPGMAITGIPSSQYPTRAHRPLNSRLDCQKIHQEFGIRQPDWCKELTRILSRPKVSS